MGQQLIEGQKVEGSIPFGSTPIVVGDIDISV